MPLSGVTNFGTGRRDYVRPNRRWRAAHRCQCRHLYADDVESQVWDVVESVLAHIDDDAEAMAEAEQLDDRLHQLDARIGDAEIAVGRVAIEVLGLDFSPAALRTLTGDLTTGLQQLRHEKTRLESMLVTVAADPGRRVRLHQVATSTRGQLTTMAAHERRGVCGLLDVRVTVQQ